MTDMIERVARSLHKKQMAGKWELLPETVRATYLDDATTAIKAMRELTGEMFDAAGFVHGADDVLPFWEAMIDAALGENK